MTFTSHLYAKTSHNMVAAVAVVVTGSQITRKVHTRATVFSSVVGGGAAATVRNQIIGHTRVTKSHLTPEISLYLITPECVLYRSKVEECPFVDPYWAFYWPGGQALTRFILDNPDEVSGKWVLDFGSGCGAASIASLMSGALRVTANDTDPTAAVAVNLNMDLNASSQHLIRCRFETNTRDLVVELDSSLNCDVVAVGDMFYDDESVDRVSEWLTWLHSRGKRIIIGDPGRLALEKHDFKQELKIIGDYPLPLDCVEQNRGTSAGYVWTFK